MFVCLYLMSLLLKERIATVFQWSSSQKCKCLTLVNVRPSCRVYNKDYLGPYVTCQETINHLKYCS